MAKAEPKKEETVADLKVIIAGLRGDVKSAETAANAEKARADKAVADYHSVSANLRAAIEDKKHLELTCSALEKRIERMSGYLDRIMDQEDENISPIISAQQAPAPKGPSVGNIPLPQRETNGRDGMWARPNLSSDIYPQRRY